jgi:hypothetical protein
MASSYFSVAVSAAAPGTTNLVPINVNTDTNIVAFGFTLTYDTNYLAILPLINGNAASNGFLLVTNLTVPGMIRAAGLTVQSPGLSNGVLFFVPFVISSNSPDRDEMLTFTDVEMDTQQGNVTSLLVTSNGVLSVTIPPAFTTIYTTNAGAIHMELSGTPGRSYVIEATTNLMQPQWIPLATNEDVDGILPFDDISAGDFQNRYYRALFSH